LIKDAWGCFAQGYVLSSCAVYVGKTVVTRSMTEEKKGDEFGKFEVLLAISVDEGWCG
jgi:hypothetical protein